VGPPLLILAALKYEAAAIARSLGLAFIAPARAAGYLPDGRPVQLRVVGMGCRTIPRGDREPDLCCCIVMAGLGGALDPELHIGDVVIDERSTFPVPAGIGRRGAIHTAADLVSTPAHKASLYRQTGALVVDLENEVARRLAAERGVPFLGLRAVSDRADEALDPAVGRLVDPSGRLRVTALAREICRRPALLADLYRLRARSGRAMASLTGALRAILRQTVGRA
jgi:adenosylhomocysteine nucleosidase